jgi:membrane associated rhomboid family serine protease
MKVSRFSTMGAIMVGAGGATSAILGASALRDWQPAKTVRPVSMRVVASRFIVLFSAFDESPCLFSDQGCNRGYSLSFGLNGHFFKRSTVFGSGENWNRKLLLTCAQKCKLHNSVSAPDS